MATSLVTQSLSFNKESKTEFLFKPLFLENDIRDIVTIMTDIQGTQLLDYVSTLTKITKGYKKGTNYTTSTGVEITQRPISVVQMKAQIAQSGDEFLGWVKEHALKKGYKLNDIQGTLFARIVLEVYAKAISHDLQRQAFWGDLIKETSTSDATLDIHYKEYDGFWTRLITDFGDSTIPASQRITMDNSAVSQVGTTTLTGTSGTGNITINGTAYLVTFNTSNTQTATDFVASHANAIAARHYGHVLTSSGAGVILTSGVEGVAFLMSANINATGDSAGNNVATTANTLPAALAADEAYDAMVLMEDAMPPEMLENYSQLRIICTRTWMSNYRVTLESDGTEAAHTELLNGKNVLTFRGIPLIVRHDWDVTIAADFPGYYTHRALLTMPKNLIWATDLNAAIDMVESWYNQDNQERNFRVEYKAGTNYRHTNYIVAAY